MSHCQGCESEEKTGKTVVVFRKFKDTGDIIALFPEVIEENHTGYCSSYMHVGQHGAANYSALVTGGSNGWNSAPTCPAHPDEYADLKRELESAPYNYQLIVKRKFMRSR